MYQENTCGFIIYSITDSKWCFLKQKLKQLLTIWLLVFLFAEMKMSYLVLVVDGQVSWLGVVVSPGGKHVIALPLAGAPVHLDLDSAHLKG